MIPARLITRHDGAAHPRRQVLTKRQQSMSLNWEMLMRCLDPITLPDALNLCRHRLLAVSIAEMLDDGIREYHLERLVPYAGKSPPVADYGLEPSPPDEWRRSVQKNNLNRRVVKCHAIPELLRPADVKNAQRPFNST